jgi:hypothetical protein
MLNFTIKVIEVKKKNGNADIWFSENDTFID